MSANGDDIDDLVSELQQLNSNFAEFLRRLDATQDEGGRGDDNPCPIDLWDVGSQASRATDIEEYRRKRREAATSTSKVKPILSGNSYEEEIEIFVQSWLGQDDSFESIRANTSKEMFKDFMQELHKNLVSGFDGDIDDMIDELDPITQFFGFPIVEENVRDPETGVAAKEEQIQVVDDDVAIPIEIVCDQIYRLKEGSRGVAVKYGSLDDVENIPRDILQPEFGPEIGSSPEDLAQRLASGLWNKRGARLEPRYAEYLPIDEKNLWDEAQ